MVSKIVKELLLLHRKADLEFLFRDDFITAEAAPLTSPRTAEPGPGILIITDTGNNADIVASDFVMSGFVGDGDPGIWEQTGIARATGQASYVSLGLIGLPFWSGWDDGQVGNPRSGWRISLGFLRYFSTAAAETILLDTAAANLELFISLRNPGEFLLSRVNGSDDWVLEWVDNLASRPTLFPMLGADGVGATTKLHTMRRASLPAPWNTDDGIATSTLDGARSAGDTFTHEADCLIEFIATTIPSGDQIEMRFRIQDATNFWQVTIDSAGDIDLDEVVAGTPTERGTAAAVIANGDRVVIIADDETIKVYEANVLRITYSSAANFKTETDGELETEGTGGSVSDIKAWPRLISGGPLNQLNAVANA